MRLLAQTGIDWAGIALERCTGLSLNEQFQKYLFAPLAIDDMSLIPSKEMQSRLAHMHARGKDGTLQARDHLLQALLAIDPDDEVQTRQVFNSGGGGMFANPQEYSSKSTFTVPQ